LGSNAITDRTATQVVTLTTSGTTTALDVNLANSIINVSYDFISVAYPDGLTEVYTYKSGGSGGSVVATITVVYTTVAKDFVSTVARS
jgi:hypothetical protein